MNKAESLAADRAAEILHNSAFPDSLGNVYEVTIAEREGSHRSVTLPLGDKPPTPSSGGGGYEEVQLPKRSAVAIWKGRGLMRMALNVTFDGSRQQPEQAALPALQTLLQFWRPDSERDEPPVLKLSGSGDAVPYQGLAWVLENVEWARAVGNSDGRRTQQTLELTFMEYRADERLQTAAAAKSKGKSKHKRKVVEVKRGEVSLGDVARHHGYKGSGKDLGLAQHPPIRDPRHIHVGQRIVIP